MNYEADLRVYLVLLFLDSKEARNIFVEVPVMTSQVTSNYSQAGIFEEKFLFLN